MKYFTLDELCRSNAAELAHIDNTPPADAVRSLENLVEQCLDPLREKWGQPILVNSGYRNKRVNKLVGGTTNSQHIEGEAADIRPIYTRDFKALYETAKKVCDFDQLLFEYNKSNGQIRCIHISCKRPAIKNRHICIEKYYL